MENGVTLAMVVALAKQYAIKYGSIGITNIEAIAPNKIRFTLADGTTYDVTLSFNAQGIIFDNAGTTIVATNVQDAIVELFGTLNNKSSVIWREW